MSGALTGLRLVTRGPLGLWERGHSGPDIGHHQPAVERRKAPASLARREAGAIVWIKKWGSVTRKRRGMLLRMLSHCSRCKRPFPVSLMGMHRAECEKAPRGKQPSQRAGG